MSSGKFGWEKANRQQAARRGLPACEPNLTTKAFCPSCGAGGLVIKFAAGQRKTYTCKQCWTNTDSPTFREVRVVAPPPKPPKKKHKQRRRRPGRLTQEFNLLQRLRFGKFKGRAVKDCPTGYLAWLLNNVKLKKSLRRSIEAFLGGAHLQAPQVGPSSEPIAGRHYVPTGDTSCPF